jgi:hypothetical protein
MENTLNYILSTPLDLVVQYLHLISLLLLLYIIIAPIYIYIYIYILGLRAIAIKYIKANYFDFLFLIINIIIFILLGSYTLKVYSAMLNFNIFFNIVYWLLISSVIGNILCGIILFVYNKGNLVKMFSIVKNRKYFYKSYYPSYIIVFAISYSLTYFENLYSVYYSVYMIIIVTSLLLIPFIVRFIYVFELNNIINSRYTLLKDKLLIKFFLILQFCIFSIKNIIISIILLCILVPVIAAIIYNICIFFGITPDLRYLEGP